MTRGTRWYLIAVVIFIASTITPFAQTFGPGLFSYLRLGASQATKISTGTGTPESAVTGSVGDLFYRTDGADGTTTYTKASGAGTTTGWLPLISATSTKTLTGTTIDAEGTGNVMSVPFTEWIRAAICNNATPSAPEWSFPTSNPGVPVCQTGSNTQYGTLDFADGSSLSAQAQLRLPNDFTGTLTARFVWFTSATAGNVVWQLATICVADAETGDPAFNAASTVTDAAKGTTLQLNDASIASVTITGCAAGETMFLKLLRDAAHASDNLAATARLVGLELTYRRAM